MKSPDMVFQKYANQKINLTIKLMEEDKKYVLIEGSREALEFLAKLLTSQAKFKKDCSIFFSPKGPGFKFFSKKSKLGLYIHRIPCEEKN